MRLATTLGATLALCTSALAWEIVVYSDSSCAQDNGDYLILSGKPGTAAACFFLGGKLPGGVNCKKYTNGGLQGPLECTDHEMTDAYSFAIDSGDFYLADSRSEFSRNCGTGFASDQKGCQSIHIRGLAVKSG